MVRFQKILQIQFKHRYFDLQKYRGFTILPTPATASSLRSYNILSKVVDDVFFLVGQDEGNPQRGIQAIREALKLVFVIQYNDDQVWNYSNLDCDRVGECFFLTPRKVEEETVISLHPERELTSAQRIEQISSYHMLDDMVKNTAAELVVKTSGDKILYRGLYDTFRQEVPFQELIAHGLLKFESAGGDVLCMCYAVHRVLARTFGILELMLEPAMVQTDTAQEYEAVIGNRVAVWRYKVVDHDQREYSDFVLYAGKVMVPTKGIRKEPLGNGQEAYWLETAEAIPLRNLYDWDYALEFTQQDLKGGKLTSRRRVSLPVPDVRRLKISRQDGITQTLSEMYIYL